LHVLTTHFDLSQKQGAEPMIMAPVQAFSVNIPEQAEA
jgi:hypothetical protein